MNMLTLGWSRRNLSIRDRSARPPGKGVQTKKCLLAGISCFALVAVGSSANAADLGLKTRPLAPPLAAPIFNWTGCYLGGHGGGGAMQDSFSLEWGGGGLAGGQVGCNYQIEHVVVGIEGEGWWSGLRTTGSTLNGFGNDTSNFTVKNTWDFDVALRAGFAWDRALIYSKVGAAWGRLASIVAQLNPP